ncbi:MAG: hypothetical protein JW709_01120 [Sedimentisphaerales bacterium]|nr:hypothetical protein [Sedimentisphaerales bacterium]
MLRWFKQLDRILRGDATRLEQLQQGQIEFSVGGVVLVTVVLAMIYGVCMGAFAMIRTSGEAYMQLIASTVKFPLLFFLTLVVTFPSLYVFNALIGSRLSAGSALRLMTAAIGVMMAVAASLGPIVVFFSVSTTSYHFMSLLNVVACTVAGLLGLAFLLRTLHRLVLIQTYEEEKPYIPTNNTLPPESAPAPVEEQMDSTPQEKPLPASALDFMGPQPIPRVSRVFKTWVLVFALVGAQMSWILRPFIGNPAQPFTWFRERESNFFMAVFKALQSLLN